MYMSFIDCVRLSSKVKCNYWGNEGIHNAEMS